MTRVVNLTFIDYDRDGERHAKYRVQFETKRGTGSQQWHWHYTYPGPIQRGYQLAGLAPEMPTP